MSISRLLKAATALAVFSMLLFAADSPFAGTWKLNAAKSKYDANSPALKNATLTVESTANMVKASVDGVDTKDQPVKFNYSTATDGTPGTVTGSPTQDG